MRSCDYFAGCDVNAVKVLSTPLHYAARNQDVAMVTLLLEFGANITKTDNNGFKPRDVLPCACPVLRQLLLHWESKMILEISCMVRKCVFEHVHAAKIHISLHICAVWSEFSLGAFWIPKDAKFRTLYYISFWPKFCFLLSCFLKYSVEWQTVQTVIRLLLKQSDLGLHCLHMSFCQTLWCSKFKDIYCNVDNKDWSDYADVQADLNLLWGHLSKGTFSDVQVQIMFAYHIYTWW